MAPENRSTGNAAWRRMMGEIESLVDGLDGIPGADESSGEGEWPQKLDAAGTPQESADWGLTSSQAADLARLQERVRRAPLSPREKRKLCAFVISAAAIVRPSDWDEYVSRMTQLISFKEALYRGKALDNSLENVLRDQGEPADEDSNEDHEY